MAAGLPYTQRAVLDGEIVWLDRKGRPQFKDLLFRAVFHAFLHLICFMTAKTVGRTLSWSAS
jgi:hypothetical protein